MQGRASIENCDNINSKLGFKKTDSGGMVGLLLKSLLTRSTLANQGSTPSLFDEFKFLTKPEIVKTLEFGAEFWIILKKMHMIACNRSQNSNE